MMLSSITRTGLKIETRGVSQLMSGRKERRGGVAGKS